MQNYEKEIIKSNISTIEKFISSSNEDNQNYLLFNEKLFLEHNKWLENVKSQINKSIKGNNNFINFPDIKYNTEIFNLLEKIAKPNDYRNNIVNTNNKEDIIEKIDQLSDFNDIIGTVNSCSKYKRDSLISRIQNGNNNNINNINNNGSVEININLNNSENNRITFNEEDKKALDEDIIMTDVISSTEKVKLDSGNTEKDVNSLCTIIEQPSMEEMKKSMFSNNIPSNKFEEKNKTGNYILDLNNNNNMSNSTNTLINKSANNTNNYKPLKLSESNITPKKDENNINMNNINNNINFGNNSPVQFSFNKNGQKKNDNSSNNKNININNGNSINLNNNSKNEITFNFSSNKKFINDPSSNKKQDNQTQNGLISTPTLNPINTSKKIDNNNINNNNFINIITNTIDKISQENNNKNNNNINNNNTNKKYVQDLILLSSTKKINELKNKSQKKQKEKEKEKYEDDFEEYEMSDSSKRNDEEEEEEDELNTKFIPEWALDEDYINRQIIKQNNNKDLVYKSFGNFIVEHLNLNMIFETHYQAFDVRNSTADWRGDDSITNSSNNKYKDNNDNDLNEFFPNRKLQFV